MNACKPFEDKPEGRIYTAYRAIDQTLTPWAIPRTIGADRSNSFAIGILYCSPVVRGTRREQRLLLLTLKEIGIASSYSENCFNASPYTVSHLRHLGWPLGNLKQYANGTKTRKRFNPGR